MNTLKKGDSGDAVKQLQTQLQAKGYKVSVDGQFGPGTETAVKAFQSASGLTADGIAGEKTQQALAFQRGAVIPTASQKISAQGLDFIYKHEAWAGVSNHLHWPGGASGVTLGPGYDFKMRTSGEIEQTMLTIGLPADVASKIAAGAGLSKDAAKAFADANKGLVSLTRDQEEQLLSVVVPPYVDQVKKGLKVNLTQYEFDCLVDFAYNPGGKLGACLDCVNKGDITGAMSVIESVVYSGGQKMEGLVNRRNDEVCLFQYGVY